MSSRIFGLFWLISAAVFAQTQDDSTETLRKIRQRVADSISHLPRYLCTETVDRQSFEIEPLPHRNNGDTCPELIKTEANSPNNLVLESTDRLRLDVALGSRTEMYSWVGEGRFDDRALSEIVAQGTTSTGAFGSFLHAIFVANSAFFQFKGRSEDEGRDVLTYDFVVPLSRSGYVVSNNVINRLTGYKGSFAVDAQTLDLLQLAIETDPLPPELRVCRTRSLFDYSRVHMSGIDVLLPSEVQVRLLGSDGRESYNRTVFRDCHQFLGESKLIFEENSTAGAPKDSAAQTRTVDIPAGLKVSVALAQAIDPETAAAGDPIAGKLTRRVKVSDSGLILPKGTLVTGRIFEVALIKLPQTTLELGLKWESITLDGMNWPLRLKSRLVLSSTARLGSDHGRWPEVETITRSEQPGVTFFLFPRVVKDYRIPAGFEAEWVTVQPHQ